MENERLLRIKQVIDFVGLSRAQIYKLCREDKFPKFHKIGGTTVWQLSEIQKYIQKIVKS